MDKMKVSQKIAELRARNGLTAKELGDKIEKSETTILNYEAGKIDIPLSSLLGIAEALEVEPSVLVGGRRRRIWSRDHDPGIQRRRQKDTYFNPGNERVHNPSDQSCQRRKEE